jgi:hypothetical protein
MAVAIGELHFDIAQGGNGMFRANFATFVRDLDETAIEHHSPRPFVLYHGIPELRPHRGISQEQLPLYLGFFEFVHNVRKRGKALLPALIELLVT